MWMGHTEGQALRLHGQVLLRRAGAVRDTAGSGFLAPLESLLLLLSCLPKSLLLAACVAPVTGNKERR